jgi:glutathione S-transferase
MMKLFYTPASPFVRKCTVALKELGLWDRVEIVPTK